MLIGLINCDTIIVFQDNVVKEVNANLVIVHLGLQWDHLGPTATNLKTAKVSS